ncbi:MAG: 2-oxoacid:acceptor oxidoreductase family protein [Spirochaetales bacterium]|nr:2-oxoacid:acceptor oxidoreductase family protein [Spirochaetales bacterium]
MKEGINIFLAGMGGQGIAFLSRILSESLLKCGYRVFGCDTHGMSQRGGSVVSHLRIGDEVFTPIISKGKADIILGLERLETLRAMETMGKAGSKIIFYDALFHPTSVRVNKAAYPELTLLNGLALKKSMMLNKVFVTELADSRLQNTIVLGHLIASNWIPGLTIESVLQVMDEMLPEYLKVKNVEWLKKSALMAVK